MAEARAQGGLVGIPHPFDRMRGSLLKDAKMASLVGLVDWVEGHNARLVGNGNDQAIAFAAEHERPIVAVSDAHSVTEVGVAYSAMDGDPVDAGRAAGRAGERRRAGPRPGDLLRPPLDAGRQAGPADPRQRPGQAGRRIRRARLTGAPR